MVIFVAFFMPSFNNLAPHDTSLSCMMILSFLFGLLMFGVLASSPTLEWDNNYSQVYILKILQRYLRQDLLFYISNTILKNLLKMSRGWKKIIKKYFLEAPVFWRKYIIRANRYFIEVRWSIFKGMLLRAFNQNIAYQSFSQILRILFSIDFVKGLFATMSYLRKVSNRMR